MLDALAEAAGSMMQNVYFCAGCEIAFTSEAETAGCLECGEPAVNIGWFDDVHLD